jgi:hypothetical protein
MDAFNFQRSCFNFNESQEIKISELKTEDNNE